LGSETNILVNLLTLTALFAVRLKKCRTNIVFGRILPATGLMMCLSTMYYAWLAYGPRQKKTGAHRHLRACLRASACRTCSSSSL